MKMFLRELLLTVTLQNVGGIYVWVKLFELERKCKKWVKTDMYTAVWSGIV